MNVLTQEKADLISNFILADEARANELYEMQPVEVAAVMKKAGLDVTEEEIKEYADAAKMLLKNDELNTEELENVAGGIGIVGGCLIALGAGILVGAMDKFKIW